MVTNIKYGVPSEIMIKSNVGLRYLDLGPSYFGVTVSDVSCQ